METMYVERLSQVEGEKEWLWKPFLETFDLEKDFAMSESELNADICKVGQLLVRYGTVAAEQNANLKRKEEAAKLAQANVSGAIRSQAEASGAKLTEAKLSEQVTVHPNYQQALSELHILRADSLKADHWWRAIVKKADLLNAMAFRQTAELKRMPS